MKGVLRNFAKFTGKHLCQGLFFDKVASLRPATLKNKRLWHKRFLVNFAKFLRTPFYITPLVAVSCSCRLLNCGLLKEDYNTDILVRLWSNFF